METTVYLSLNEAAKKTKRSKGTISKALSSGKLSHVSKDENGYKIDPSELFRVFPIKREETSKSYHSETPENTTENRALKKEIELLREQLKREQEQSDHWRNQAEKITLLLTNENTLQSKTPSTLKQQTPKKKKGVFRRLLGRR